MEQGDASMNKPCDQLTHWHRWVETSPSPVVLDGGMGYTLEQRGIDLSTGFSWTGNIIVNQLPQLRTLAEDWLRAGADIICTASYQLTLENLRRDFNLSADAAESHLAASITALHEARLTHWHSLPATTRHTRRFPAIALSLGPYIATLPSGNEYKATYPDHITDADLQAFHTQRSLCFLRLAPNVNVLAFETIGNATEALAIVHAMSHTNLRCSPYWLSLQCRTESSLASSHDLSSTLTILLKACTPNLVALGVNCVDATHTLALVSTIKHSIKTHQQALPVNQRHTIHTIAYPNSGEQYTSAGWVWPSSTFNSSDAWASLLHCTGSRIVGGCCRTGPAHIHALRIQVDSSIHTPHPDVQ